MSKLIVFPKQKLINAKQYLRDRSIYRGDPACNHEYKPGNPDAMLDSTVTIRDYDESRRAKNK